MQISKYFRFFAAAVATLTCFTTMLTAGEHRGNVKYGGLPLPGATITATQGDKKLTAVADGNGSYVFADIADGTWSMEVEMLCFEPMKQDITVAAGAAATDWELKLLSFDKIKATAVEAPPPPPPTVTTSIAAPPAPSNDKKPADTKKNAKNAPAAPPANGPGGFQRTQANATAAAPAADAAPAPASENFAGRSAADASDGFLVNGNSNNSATSPFALSAAFGNNRRGPRSLYNGNLSLTIDNSSLDARQFSITGQDTERPPYNRVTGAFNFGGPIKIPHVVRNGPIFFVGYQWTRNRNSSIGTGEVPTDQERKGDFSQVPALPGQPPVQLINPANGQPISNNVISPDLITTQARALLKFYPIANFTGSSAFNYQIPLVNNQHTDAMQVRLQKGIGRKNQLSGQFAFQSGRNDNPNIFGFLDTSHSLGFNASATWRHSFTNRLSGTTTYTFSRQSNTNFSFFANRENVSGEAGITGNNQAPINWGPPQLSFASGISGLSDNQSSIFHNQTHALAYAMLWSRGRHQFQYGADFKRQQFNTFSQQDPRGTFQFTGAAAGYDFAGFLLGVPDATSIAFGNADKYFRASLYDGFINDDWRVSPGFTLNLGFRWEYNSPITELFGRMVNLDVTPGFKAAAPVTADHPVGSLTGMHYADSLVNPDKHAFQPRLALSWRPLPASSLVVRAGYGVYYNTSVYNSIAAQMAQQAPFSKSLSQANTAANPLTLANGFNAPPNVLLNTFGIDPNFRVGYTHTWQVSVQRDLPAALIMNASYLGIKGTRGVQEFLPNTYPTLANNPCPTCPSGFGYLVSNGNSTRQQGQLQMRRRLHNGFTSSVTYTYSKSIDDSALGGGNQIGRLIAQNWLDLDGERGLSIFDQRHLVNIQGQYTSGMGMHGGGLMSGWRGTALKEWTIVTTVNVGTGLPLTPIYSVVQAGTGLVGTIRPDYTGLPLYNTQDGRNLNTKAYTAPAAGHYGNAGRDSITGPGQFTLNASMQRTFRATDRISLTLRVDLNNALNHVTFPNWVTNINSSQFGLPLAGNQMRTLSTNIRMGF
jgi:hypothetical protein